jgi:hypothetical protein
MSNRAPRQRLQLVVATVSPAASGHPRPKTGRRRKASLLAPGSVALVRLPRAEAPVAYRTSARRLQLRGQPRSFTAFPFDPSREPCTQEEHIPRSAQVNRLWDPDRVPKTADMMPAVPVGETPASRRLGPPASGRHLYGDSPTIAAAENRRPSLWVLAGTRAEDSRRPIIHSSPAMKSALPRAKIWEIYFVPRLL